MKLLGPLRERDFALLWAGMTVSLLGDGIYLVAVAWQVYDLSNDPTALSLVGLSWTIGMVAFLLTGGVVSDRVERRRVMIGADLVRAAVLVVIGILSVSGVLEVWHLVALVVLFGAGEAFFGPAFGAILPDLVPGEQLVQANALDQLVRQSAGRLIGPALGGFVVAALGAGSAFLLDAATFAVSAACIAALRVRSLPQTDGAERSARAELREGVVFVRSQPWLWATLIAAAVSLLMFLGPLEVLLPFVVRNDLHAGAGSFGAILAAAGAGSVVTSLVLSQRGLPRRYLTFMYATWCVGTLPLVGYALGNAVWQLMALAVFYGACMSAGNLVWATLMQTRVPPGLRGRVHSLDWFVSIGLTPVSFALTGPVSKAIGVDATLIAAGAVPAVLTAALFFLARLRADEQRHPPLPVAPAEAIAATV
ncbi:MAG: major facilitator superfamily protein [Solirubrobacterales bacterium]|nr:major facilitator superfamily protein [Solirubrobacterales bacterium]